MIERSQEFVSIIIVEKLSSDICGAVVKISRAGSDVHYPLL